MQEEPPISTKHIVSKHSSFISNLKYLILFTIVMLILAIIILPLTDYGQKGFKLTFEKKDIGSDFDKPTMIKPKLHGINQDDKPYNLSADKAIQSQKNIIELYKLEGDIYLKDDSWVSLFCDEAVYNTNSREVDLIGNVNVFVDNGYEIQTNSARVFLKTGSIKGNEKAVIHGPMGIIKANGFIIKNSSRKVKFTGGTHLRAFIGTKE